MRSVCCGSTTHTAISLHVDANSALYEYAFKFKRYFSRDTANLSQLHLVKTKARANPSDVTTKPTPIAKLVCMLTMLRRSNTDLR